MFVRTDARTPFLLTLAALAVVCWLALAAWSASPYAGYLSHEAVGGGHGLGGGAATAALFVAGWVLMTVAMMLPTSLPLVALFQRLTHARRDALRLALLLVAGYLAVWILFGLLAHTGDRLLHEGVHRVAWLDARPWVIGAGVLATAGLYQFSSLKYACLDACRSPLSFLVSHWHGEGASRSAFVLGMRHGLFCVGCCWTLMLLMFALAGGNLGWMLLVGAIMAVEKNMPWGKRLSRPLGVALLALSAFVALTSTGHL